MELTHNAAERSNDTVFYSSDDDVIRKNTAAGMRESLGLNNVNNTGATVTATADKIVLRDSEGDIFAAGVGIGTTSPDLELHVHDANNANSGIVLSSTTGYHRLYEASGQLYIQSGAAASADSRADINFTSMYASTTYMKILGSNGNVGIGTASPTKLFEISGASGLDNSTPVHFRITNTQEATNGSPFTDITKPAALISYYTPDTSTAGKGDVAGIGFRPESTIGGDTALCFYTDGDNADDNALQERMCITHEGNVGIGVTSPGYKLHVNGSIYGSGVTTPYLTGHGYIAERSYTFNPTSNTTKYFLGWTDQDSMQISIRDSGWGHGGTLYATVYFQWGNTPSIVIHKQSGDYTFYYTYKNDRMYLWFNNSGNSNNNNIIHSIRMRTTVGAISTTEPGSTETYASTTIGSSAATEFTTIRLCSTKDGNVGIGTTNPSYTLDVDGHINLSTGSTLKINGTDAVFSRWTASGSDIYRSSGNVGIGTTSPATDFHVGAEDANIRIGAINYSGSAANTTTYGLERSRNQILFSTWRDAQTDKIGAKICGINKQTYSSPAVRHLIQSTDLAFYTVPPGSASHDGTVERLRITDTGNVGIGTTSPSTALDVTGGYGYFRQGTMIGDYGSHGHTQHRTHIKDGSGSQTLYQVFLMRKNNNWTPGVIKLYWARTNVNGSGFDGYYTSWKYIRYSASGIQTGAMNGSTSQITLGYSTAGSAYDEIQITISGSERIIVDIEISDVYGFVM
jgi:hypothetical protein